MLSRNFRLQRVGDLNWLEKNYNFAKISPHIDELVVLNVSRNDHAMDNFLVVLASLSKSCFIPITAGGGIRTAHDAAKLFNAGADKISLNTLLFQDQNMVELISLEYGQQSIVGSIDLRRNIGGAYEAYTNCGLNKAEGGLSSLSNLLEKNIIGEIYLNSIDKDGTGQGLDFGVLEILPDNLALPVIIAGGIGNTKHLESGLADQRIDAVATANLFNFVGDALKNSRSEIIGKGFNLPIHGHYKNKI